MAKRSSGFTLIELMVAVTIIGALATVAMPALRTVQLRARQAERAMMMTAIRRSVDDAFMRTGRFPGPGLGDSSFLWLDNNPGVFVYGPEKKPWRFTSWGDHWLDLAFRPEGGLYYVYSGFGTHLNLHREYTIVATGDLDGDGVVSELTRFYSYDGTTLDTTAGTCLDCSSEAEVPPDGVSF